MTIHKINRKHARNKRSLSHHHFTIHLKSAQALHATNDKPRFIKAMWMDGAPGDYESPFYRAEMNCISEARKRDYERYSGIGGFFNQAWDAIFSSSYEKESKEKQRQCVTTKTKEYEKEESQGRKIHDGFWL